MDNELPPAPEEMQQMAWFIGEWEVVSRFLNKEGEWIEEHLRAEHSYVLGGHTIFEHFGGPVFQMPFEGWSLRKYNTTEKRWEQRWVDVSAGGFADWTGHWDADSKTFTGYANRTLDEEGKPKETAVREVFSDISAQSFAWRFERTTDNGQSWTVSWTLDYTRRAAV